MADLGGGLAVGVERDLAADFLNHQSRLTTMIYNISYAS
jgi:hypothetical protein